ncbi:MAG: hypothetical protein SYC29_05290 [Planctomycetota bacterium]|nr:hypothetical protein [Planctomycetota bacterium]
MKLSIWPLTIAAAILWGAVMLLCGIANLIWPSYAVAFLEMCASVYPGYDAETNIGEVIVGTLYAIVDGAIFGLVLALLYNAFVRPAKKAETGAA